MQHALGIIITVIMISQSPDEQILMEIYLVLSNLK